MAIRNLVLALLVAILFVPAASAGPVVLFDWGFNVDGTVYVPGGGALPAAFDTSLFDFESGLGIITLTITGAGAHNVIGFFDHEIREDINGFSNEYAATVGSPLPGQSWEIDEPDFVFGNIYTHFLAGLLDNTNGVPITSPDDPALAIGWNFTLDEGVTAVITFVLSQTAPGIFYLQQTDPPDFTEGTEHLYYSSTLSVGGDQVIPEPGTWLLVATGIGVAALVRKRLA